VERNDEWFENPLDSMPIATNNADWYDNAPSEYEPPMTDNDWFIDKPKDTYSSRHKSTPDSEKSAEEVVTMHEKMYRMATKNGSTITMGGSESLNSIGGSENHVK
jgi:hypothetical protein